MREKANLSCPRDHDLDFVFGCDLRLAGASDLNVHALRGKAPEMRLPSASYAKVDVVSSAGCFHFAATAYRDIEFGHIDVLQYQSAGPVQSKVAQPLAGQDQIQLAAEVEARGN